MLGLTVRSALAAIAIAASTMGLAAGTTAAPSGPCEDVPYVGVCEPLPGSPQTPSQQGMGDVVLPNGSSFQSVG